jgi:predicted regulator of Ras-like GTPase activity (Roadblock/LC7/MglB family)
MKRSTQPLPSGSRTKARARDAEEGQLALLVVGDELTAVVVAGSSVDVKEDALEVRIRAEGLASLVGELRQQGERIAA